MGDLIVQRQLLYDDKITFLVFLGNQNVGRRENEYGG